MNTTFLISGGAGRVACAIPALEKFYHLNPENNFKVLVTEWDMFFWSNPILQNRTFEISKKGCFEEYVKNYNLVVPEPYHYYRYYNQQVNLVEAFDELINNDFNHKDLKQHNYLYLTSIEKSFAKQTINQFKLDKQKDKVIAFQPFGSGSQLVNNEVVDETNRSISRENYLKFVNILSEYASVIYIGPENYRHEKDTNSVFLINDSFYMRNLINVISECDYFLGIDSVGQHIAKSFKIPGLMLVGATDERNVSYPDYFRFFKKNNNPSKYIPMRISDTDTNFANRTNDGVLDLSDYEIDKICEVIANDLKRGKQ